MTAINIISSSIRNGRNSHRLSLFLKAFLEAQKELSVEILDLDTYDFPLFRERLNYLKDPSRVVLDFAKKIRESDGIIIVTPEYNGGYPAALKNIIDLLHSEWQKKPVAFATTSSGAFAGSQVITSLQFTLWKIGAWTVNAYLPVPNIDSVINEKGVAANPEPMERRTNKMIQELLWCIEANRRMRP